MTVYTILYFSVLTPRARSKLECGDITTQELQPNILLVQIHGRLVDPGDVAVSQHELVSQSVVNIVIAAGEVPVILPID